MEYIEGESLSALVKRCGALDEAIAVTYIRHIADALDYIHEQKINHLDVKPGNIMVRTKDDNAILIDFGLAKHYDDGGDQTSSTPVGISHGYAPFEQYKSGGVSSFSPATDIYSLGATLYYLVTGKVPPSATDIGKDGIKTPDNLSPGVQRAIKEAMNYWREERPQSIDDFLKLLDDKPEVVAPVAEATIINVETKSVDESTVINVEPTQTTQPAPQPKRPKRGLWIMLAAFVVAAVASFVLLGGGSSAPKQQLPPNNEIWYTSSDGKVVKPHI
jgi:serine/threonine protein kinase